MFPVLWPAGWAAACTLGKTGYPVDSSVVCCGALRVAMRAGSVLVQQCFPLSVKYVSLTGEIAGPVRSGQSK